LSLLHFTQQEAEMKQRGFTLIELMIVIAIIGILVSVVMPSYRNYVLESQREDVKAKLLQVVQLQERFYQDNISYTQNMAGTFNTGTGLGFTTNGNGQWEVDFSGIATYGVEIFLCADNTIYPDLPNITQCFIAVATPIGPNQDENRFMGLLAADNRGRKVLDFNQMLIRDWNDNDLPDAMCPDCIAARVNY
jgi:type IV pilus assembly protein PilE